MVDGQQISWLLAFLAGLVSFMSPCVLPMVPAYIGYLTGLSINDLAESGNQGRRKLILLRAIGFVLGFTLIFVFFGAAVTLLGTFLGRYRYLLQQVGGVLIFVFGMHLAGIITIPVLYSEKRLGVNPGAAGFSSAVLMGMAFASGWSACVGPILSAILLYAGATATLAQGVTLLLVYSLGLSLPFILTAVALGSFLRFFGRFSAYLPYVSLVGGGLLMLMGLLVFTNQLARLNPYFNFFPNLERVLLP